MLVVCTIIVLVLSGVWSVMKAVTCILGNDEKYAGIYAIEAISMLTLAMFWIFT